MPTAHHDGTPDIVLADDGTMDTVFLCCDCGGEERYTFAGGDGEETYEEFREWAYQDALDTHECEDDGGDL